MLRKLTIILCLVTFAPTAVNAQGPAALTASHTIPGPAKEQAFPPAQALNLSLPAETLLMASAETSESEMMKSAPEQKKEARSEFNWGNFADVHLGGYRWIWWAGAAAALIAIHAGAD